MNLKSVLKGELKPIEIDWEKQKVVLKKAQDDWHELKTNEELRIQNMECPCCKSPNKRHHMETSDNGVLGPGFHSRITTSYYICLNCGVHYSDLNYTKLPAFPTGIFNI